MKPKGKYDLKIKWNQGYTETRTAERCPQSLTLVTLSLNFELRAL